MEKFKVGDKVRIRKWDDMEKQFGRNSFGSIACMFSFTDDMRPLCGRTATIERITEEAHPHYRLLFDGESSWFERSWNYSADMLEHVNPEVIVIYRKEREVIAMDKRDGRKFVAKCSKDDAFDFDTGAALAFNRLLLSREEKKPQYYTGKIVCVECGDSRYTVGRVYNVKDGFFVDDDGDRAPTHDDLRLTSATSYNGALYKFIEFKGEA